MGCYLDRKDDESWGLIANDEDFPVKIKYIINNRQKFSPRKYYSKEYTLERCREKWTSLIEEFVN
jgi:glycosyltransferase involved in cell wall biosynthesis